MKRLNKIIALILTFSFLVSGIALATIEKDQGKKNTNNSVQNITPGDSTNDTGLNSDSGGNSNRPQGYDDFVDKNNNGIDDRVEKKQDGRKKDSSQDNSTPNSLNQQGDSNRIQRSPDDSVVKLKNR